MMYPMGSYNTKLIVVPNFMMASSEGIKKYQDARVQSLGVE